MLVGISGVSRSVWVHAARARILGKRRVENDREQNAHIDCATSWPYIDQRHVVVWPQRAKDQQHSEQQSRKFSQARMSQLSTNTQMPQATMDEKEPTFQSAENTDRVSNAVKNEETEVIAEAHISGYEVRFVKLFLIYVG